VAACERLFAERGIERVSLNEIVAAAGQRNASAIHYHFGDRDGLMRAVLSKHQPGIERERTRLLDALESETQPPIRSLAEALVLPVAAKLADPDGGSAYVRVMAQLLHGGVAPNARLLSLRDNIARDRLIELVRRASPALPQQVAHLRGLLVATQLFHALSDLARLEEAGLVETDGRALFVTNLIDCIAGSLAAPVSDATLAAAGATAAG
jgi:AcrR family transcriptional regulator